MNAAIKVENLSKLYRIGVGDHASYRTLRDSIMQTITAPFQRMRASKAEDSGANADDLWALKDVSFEVKPGEVVGIVGRNGAGKSTLLKVLSRITPPTGGSVRIGGRVGSLLEVGTGFHPELTGRENIYLNGAILGMSRREISKKFDDIVAFSEVDRFLDTPVKRYSSGMYTRLAFAVASHLEPEVLIVDEVLAVGDAQFQKKCLGRMNEVSREGRTVLFVSHNMSAMKSLCTRGIVMMGGRVGFDGDIDEAVNRYLDVGSGKARDGIIPDDFPRISDVKGEALIRQVRLTDLEGKDTTQLYFGQPFQVEVTIEAIRDIVDAHVEISFSTHDGIQVTYSAATDGGIPPICLKKGLHKVVGRFDNVLLPRDYAIDVGVHHHTNGSTADFVQRTFDFLVLRVAESGDDHYHWPRTRGLVRARRLELEWRTSGEYIAGIGGGTFMSRVDVVIPCYKYGHFLRECVTSVLSQEGVETRVLIIDDCSPDDSADVGRKLAAEDSRVEFRRHEVNQRHIATYNEGLLEWAGGDYCLLLSADDRLAPGALGRAAAILDQHPECGFAYGRARILRTGAANQEVASHPEKCQWRIISGTDYIRSSCRSSENNIKTPTVVVRTSLQKQVGGYRKDLPHAGDMEMWLRLAAFSSLAYTDTEQACYRVHGENMFNAYNQMADYRQRREVFEILFREHGNRIEDASGLKKIALRALSQETLVSANTEFDRQEMQSCREFVRLSEEIDPSIHLTMAWRRFKLKQMMGARVWKRVSPAVRGFRSVLRGQPGILKQALAAEQNPGSSSK